MVLQDSDILSMKSDTLRHMETLCIYAILLGLLLHADWDWFIAQWCRQLFKTWWPSGYTLESPGSAAADVSD
jgi:hypothetical protein